MAKKTPRRLWLKIAYDAKGASRKKVVEYLLAGINNGTYSYPHKWRVAIGWSNKINGDLKWGEWTKEMKASAQSSPGFDITVRQYLERQK